MPSVGMKYAKLLHKNWTRRENDEGYKPLKQFIREDLKRVLQASPRSFTEDTRGKLQKIQSQ